MFFSQPSFATDSIEVTIAIVVAVFYIYLIIAFLSLADAILLIMSLFQVVGVEVSGLESVS